MRYLLPSLITNQCLWVKKTDWQVSTGGRYKNSMFQSTVLPYLFFTVVDVTKKLNTSAGLLAFHFHFLATAAADVLNILTYLD